MSDRLIVKMIPIANRALLFKYIGQKWSRLLRLGLPVCDAGGDRGTLSLLHPSVLNAFTQPDHPANTRSVSGTTWVPCDDDVIQLLHLRLSAERKRRI